MRISDTVRSAVIGLLCGAVNGMFGSGGGIIAVSALEYDGSDPKKAHADSLFLTLAVSIVSTYVYYKNGDVFFKYVLYLLPGGITGAAVGCVMMKKLSSDSLKRLFSCIMIYMGIRLITH